MIKLFIPIFFCISSFAQITLVEIKTGADALYERKFKILVGKKVGLVTNHSAVLANGKHLADALHEQKNFQLVVLFGPEHGIRGDAPDGKTIQDAIDEKTGVQVFSLYGKINKPTPEMLKNVDVLVFDIQDIGARFYTFITTMFLTMEAAAENNIQFVVLDRPNPIRGMQIEGPIREDSLRSFVGWMPIPIAHGMTVGELATMANEQGWLKNGVKANLTVIKMNGWKRELWYDETSLRWIKPSPNMATLRTATVYPGMCLIEATNLSEGRGTEKPFEYIGAPCVNGEVLAKKLNDQHLRGVQFQPITFMPRDISGAAVNPKHKNILCGGVYVNVIERNNFESVKTGIAILSAVHELYPDSLQIRERGLNRLVGVSKVYQMILNNATVDSIVDGWKKELMQFDSIRKKYFFYK